MQTASSPESDHPGCSPERPGWISLVVQKPQGHRPVLLSAGDREESFSGNVRVVDPGPGVDELGRDVGYSLRRLVRAGQAVPGIVEVGGRIA